MEIAHLRLQEELRSELKDPVGELIFGTIAETSKIIQKRFSSRSFPLIGVGDVTAKILIDLNLDPEIIVTDGQTKRARLEKWLSVPNYREIMAKCPPAEITSNAWHALRDSVKLMDQGYKVHLKIEGEEDLLVLPLIVELPTNARIIYGQPNQGAVVRIVDTSSQSFARKFLNRMQQMEKS